jgi:hypothetical protein
VVAQTESVEFIFAIVNLDRAGRAAKLFEVTLGELDTGIAIVPRRDPLIPLPLAQLTTPGGGGGPVVKFQVHPDKGIAFERLRRFNHFKWIFQDADLPRIGDAVMLERLDNPELEAARVVRVVVIDFGTPEHEANRGIRSVQANSHFGCALVWPITQSHKATEPLSAVEKVVIGAFIEVGFAGVGMHQIVVLEQDNSALSHWVAPWRMV